MAFSPAVLLPLQRRSPTFDWSAWYVTDEQDMPHSPLHTQVTDVFHSSLKQLALQRGGMIRQEEGRRKKEGEDEMRHPARAWEGALATGTRGEYIGKDEFFAWVEDEPMVRVSPDVFVVPTPPPHLNQSSWQTWYRGHEPPLFALEIVSDDWEKDYQTNPDKYSQLGCNELVIFDPYALERPVRATDRVLLQVYRRDDQGEFNRVYRGSGSAWSEELNVWLVVRWEGKVPTLRLSHDAAGRDLVPTTEEYAEQEKQRADREAQRADDERKRAEVLAAKLRELGVDPEMLK